MTKQNLFEWIVAERDTKLTNMHMKDNLTYSEKYNLNNSKISIYTYCSNENQKFSKQAVAIFVLEQIHRLERSIST